MIGLKLNAAKSMFFDRAKVIGAMDAATRRALSKFGAFVRTAAKSSIRKRKKVSAAGQPPSSHTGLLKKFIYFGYDATTQSVVIGPTVLNGTSGTAPETLEYGGEAIIQERPRGAASKRQRAKKEIKIAARPYMNPALKKESPKLPQMWRDSLRP